MMGVGWAVLLVLEGWALYVGQRQIFGSSLELLGKLPAYALAVPGTVLHELSHYFVCKLLGVQTGEVSLFRPRQAEDGSITLGYVMHAQADPLRSALVAIAPLLLVPPLLLGVTMALLGTGVLHDPAAAISSASWWKLILWGYISLSAGQGAFPSVGDHIGFSGFVALALLVVGLFLIVPRQDLLDACRIIVLLLSLPAVTAVLSLLLLRGLWRRRR